MTSLERHPNWLNKKLTKASVSNLIRRPLLVFLTLQTPSKALNHPFCESFNRKEYIHIFMLGMIIDTSSEYAILAIVRGEKIISQIFFESKNALSHRLLPEIDQLLKSHETSPKELSYIAVGKGPGSYTGTRVGVSIARALAFALLIPLISFCSLKAFINLPAGSFLNWLEGKNGTIYALRGRIENGVLEEEKQGLFTFADWESLTTGVDALIPQKEAHPKVEPLVPLLIEKYRKKLFGCEIVYLNPI